MSKSATKVERRKFKMHPKLLMDVIKRQAGTLAKAIMEGVMNAVDAKATECRVSITHETVTLDDDGHGITEREHIEKFFETFGQPHEEEEGKTYGTFRMGRGQMFSFGVNKWTTGPFIMHVNVKDLGLEYDLHVSKSVGDERDGCAIEIQLYEQLKPSEVRETVQQVTDWCQYAPIQLYINNKLVSKPPEAQKWDHVLDEAYIKLRDMGNLVIYNLGVHTLEFPNNRFGTGGIVVSRQQLKVNFARNDIQSDCPVWRKVKPKVSQYAAQRTRESKTLTDGQRQRLSEQIRTGDLTAWQQIAQLKLITTVTGRHYEVKKLHMLYDYGNRLSVCQLGDRRGDKLFQHKTAFILAQETLDRFQVDSPRALLDLLETAKKEWPGRLFDAVKIVPFAELVVGMSDDYDLLTYEELTLDEQTWLGLIQAARRHLRLAHRDDADFAYYDRRRIVLGVSQHAYGWTDGKTYIAVSRNFLKQQKFDMRGFFNVGRLLLHEFCHDGPDTAEHTHGQEFYELFHDSSECVGEFAYAVAKSLPAVCQRLQRRVNKGMLKNQDVLHDVAKAKRVTSK